MSGSGILGIKFFRCEYTGEICIGTRGAGGYPVFGHWVPFFGWKWIGCLTNGDVDNDTWPPRYLVLKLGVMWFGHGIFWTPYGATVRNVPYKN